MADAINTETLEVRRSVDPAIVQLEAPWVWRGRKPNCPRWWSRREAVVLASVPQRYWKWDVEGGEIAEMAASERTAKDIVLGIR